MNVYLPDGHWDALREAIALRGMTPEDAADPVMLEIARSSVDELLANFGVMPASTRDEIEAAA